MEIFTENTGLLLDAIGTTLLMVVVAGVGSLILGVLVAVARVSPIPILRRVAFLYSILHQRSPLGVAPSRRLRTS